MTELIKLKYLIGTKVIILETGETGIVKAQHRIRDILEYLVDQENYSEWVAEPFLLAASPLAEVLYS